MFHFVGGRSEGGGGGGGPASDGQGEGVGSHLCCNNAHGRVCLSQVEHLLMCTC